ncbi:MAG: SCO family protein [Gammaproteobacteria bacterium]|nr:SCO family protein [Gammaproteobacteria bacterium]NNF61262.1 SCO family protein [Gammaproteobacteria bacterium]NNM21706.1 SCO family protein [Gammaproteobacteria bacterium]
MRQKVFVIGLISLVTVLAIGWYGNARPRFDATPDTFLLGTVWPDPRPLPELELLDHRGAQIGRDQFKGQWTMMFFGYTSCPDICPTTMLTLRSVVAEMEKTGAIAPRVALVTVDPERDDAPTLARYVAHFNEDFIGLRGGDDGLRALSMHVGAMFEHEAADENGSYEIAHSASLFLIDPEARLHAVFSPPHNPADIAEKLIAIRARYEQG